MTEIYCFVDDFLKACPALSRWRRSPHSTPRFTDAEVLTVALLQSDVDTIKLKLLRYNLAHAGVLSA